ncbi:putative membrane protein [Nymphaea thermarum]|nr:putative membrane protein [Nymphaea thermarum]
MPWRFPEPPVSKPKGGFLVSEETCPVEPLEWKCLQCYQNLLNRQEAQLKKLESLVENLRESISRMELPRSDSNSKASSPPKIQEESVEDHRISKEQVVVPSVEIQEKEKAPSENRVSRKKDGDRLKGGISVTKYRPTWQERFQFLSAVKLDFEVTCINVLPFEDVEGTGKYIAVGDRRGRVYLLLSNGDVIAEFPTLSSAGVTSMLSYMYFERNEGVLVTGHSDGSILVHRIWEGSNGGGSNGEDGPYLSIEHLRTLVLPPKGEGVADGPVSDEESAVVLLEVHQIGRMRYVLGCNARGRIQVFKENGTLYGTAVSSSRPLAFFRQRLLFLTESGAGSLDLRNMVIREGECDGLNGSLVKNYAFDVSERSKAYGFTSDGDIVHVVLLGDVINFKCRVRAKKKSELDGPLGAHSIKGYLLAVNSDKVFVYNISSQVYVRGGSLRPLFSATVDEIVSSFSDSPPRLEDVRKPSITGNRERLVVLGLGNGYVGIYRSNLPVLKAELSSILWSGPVLLFILFLIVVWQFLGKIRDALALWGPDDTFNMGVAGSSSTLLGPGHADRTFEDASRTDGRDLRDSFRGRARRYGSPSRYPPENTSFTSGSAMAFRSSSTVSAFRATADLNYRAPKVEAAGFHQRREPLFAHTQVVEDTIR